MDLILLVGLLKDKNKCFNVWKCVIMYVVNNDFKCNIYILMVILYIILKVKVLFDSFIVKYFIIGYIFVCNFDCFLLL